MEFIQTNKAPKAIGPYSQAVKAGDFLFISGQLPIIPESGELLTSDITSQTTKALENVINILASAEMNKENICKVTIFIKNMDNFADINKAYENFFGSHKPARAVVEVSRLPKDADIEIEAVAYNS